MKVSSWVLYIKKDKVLILLRSENVNNPEQWCLPGGSSKKHTKKKLARKELKEETGITPKKMRFFLEVKVKNRLYRYYVVFTKKDKPLELDNESSTFSWVHIKDLQKVKPKHNSLKYLFQPYKYIL